MEDKATFAHRPIDVGKERLVHIQRDEFNLDLDDRLSTQAHGARHEDAFVACFALRRNGAGGQQERVDINAALELLRWRTTCLSSSVAPSITASSPPCTSILSQSIGPISSRSESSVAVLTSSRETTRHSSAMPLYRSSREVLGSNRDEVIGAEFRRNTPGRSQQ